MAGGPRFRTSASAPVMGQLSFAEPLCFAAGAPAPTMYDEVLPPTEERTACARLLS